jgi:hypothetical protein
MVALYALASRLFGRKPAPASPGVAESGGGISSCAFNYKFRLYIPFSGLQSSDVCHDVYSLCIPRVREAQSSLPKHH